jgi:carbon-monoxide dehydrogenase medium subunit
MKMPKFEYARPSSVEEAVQLLAKNDGAKIISGGQSLLPILAFRLNYPSLLVDLRDIKGLSDIDISEEGVKVGARVRWVQIEEDQKLATAHPLLVSMISNVAHYQIRNRGTVGGSLSHGDPAAEMPGLSVTCECTLTIVGSNGERQVPASEFYTGALETVLEPDEILTQVRFPHWPPGRKWGFEEFSHRKGDFAIAGVAVFYDLSSVGVIENAHVGVIGAASTPIRLAPVEGRLNGSALSEELIAEMVELGAASVDPQDDAQISSDYRRSLVGTLLGRVLRSSMSC